MTTAWIVGLFCLERLLPLGPGTISVPISVLVISGSVTISGVQWYLKRRESADRAERDAEFRAAVSHYEQQIEQLREESAALQRRLTRLAPGDLFTYLRAEKREERPPGQRE